MNQNVIDCGPEDHGATFVFNLGDLQPGNKTQFLIAYGYAQNNTQMTQSVTLWGGEVASIGKNGLASYDSDIMFGFMFKGVGGVSGNTSIIVIVTEKQSRPPQLI